MSADRPPAAAALDAAGIPYTLFTHSGPVRSLEQAAAERGQSPQQVVRSILFRLSEDNYALVLVSGPAQIPWKALRAFFGQSRLSLASEDEVLAVTGFPIGAVGPFGIIQDLPIYLDQGLLAQPQLSIGSGQRGTAILLSPQALQQVLPRAVSISLFDS